MAEKKSYSSKRCGNYGNMGGKKFRKMARQQSRAHLHKRQETELIERKMKQNEKRKTLHCSKLCTLCSIKWFVKVYEGYRETAKKYKLENCKIQIRVDEFANGLLFMFVKLL